MAETQGEDPEAQEGVGVIVQDNTGSSIRIDGKLAKDRDDEDQEETEGRKGDYDANFFADDDAALPFDVALPIDDDDDDDDNDAHGEQAFTDAREMLSPPPHSANGGVNGDSQGPDAQTQSQSQTQMDDGGSKGSSAGDSNNTNNNNADLLPGSFGSQLVTGAGGRRIRPEYVNYARVAKKVDVRQLKEKMWAGMSASLLNVISGGGGDNQGPRESAPQTQSAAVPDIDGDGDTEMMDVDDDGGGAAAAPTAAASSSSSPQDEQQHHADGGGSSDGVLKFTDLMHDLAQVYPAQQMKEISTSYCFICLLHLANEKGLVLEGDYVEGAEGESGDCQSPSQSPSQNPSQSQAQSRTWGAGSGSGSGSGPKREKTEDTDCGGGCGGGGVRLDDERGGIDGQGHGGKIGGGKIGGRREGKGGGRMQEILVRKDWTVPEGYVGL